MLNWRWVRNAVGEALNEVFSGKRKRVHLYRSESLARTKGMKYATTVNGDKVLYVSWYDDETDRSMDFGDWRKVGEAWKDEVCGK